MNLYNAPEVYEKNFDNLSIFLAGSIEMGKAVNWQERVITELSRFSQVDILNPRRPDWDSSWEQKITNPQFNEQVTWELDNLEAADFIFMYLQPETLSPISLLELGMFAEEASKLIVCCPDGFWRKGNVDIVCNRFDIDLFDNLTEAIDHLIGVCAAWQYDTELDCMQLQIPEKSNASNTQFWNDH